MALDFGMQEKTICGFHKKDTNEFGIIEKDLPMLVNENDAMFLLTRDHFLTITTPQIKAITNNYLRYKKFNDIKRLIANILVIPGVVIAIGYVFKFAKLLTTFPIIEEILDHNITNVVFGISILCVLILWHDFFEHKINPIQLPKTHKISQKEIDEIKATGFKFSRYAHLNIISFASNETLELICENSTHGNISIYEIFKDILSSDLDVQQMLRRSGIKFDTNILDEVQEISKETLPTYPATATRSLLVYAIEEALLTESTEIQPQHLFIAICKTFPVVRDYLQKNGTTIDILREVCRYNRMMIERRNKTKYLDPNIIYYKRGGIAESWIYGYTYILDHFSKDITEQVSESRDVFGIGHDDEIENLVSVLGKITSKNALLIGEPGVGKSSLILGIAQRINTANVPKQLSDKRIIQLDLNGLIAFSMNSGNLEELIMKAIKELENAGNTILYIDEIQEIIPARAEESNHSIAGILLPYIMNSKFPIIGSINYSDYKKYFYTNESLRQSFTNIEVKEVSTTNTLKILETKVESLEKNFGCYITYPSLVTTVELAQRYIKERKLPSSAVQTIEATCSWAQSNNIDKITSEHVSKAISIQKSINVTSIDQEESNKLRKLEENIKKRVVGQEEAVTAITESLRRARTDVRNPNKPMGVFLFMGPTGVGKTHLAKVVGEEFFGANEEIIRIDMSEYQDVESINKLLGSNNSNTNIMGQSQVTLIDKIKTNPYTVVLFDEIEKAHTSILDLFLQLFDEGRLTSSSGETVDFTNTIIICTSNIGSKILLDSLQRDETLWEEAKNRALLELRQALKPELINRFDKVIVFSPQNIDDLAKIADLILNELAKRLNTRNLSIKWSSQIPMLIASKAHEPGMGARPLKRYIQDKVEGNIAREMIEGNVKTGDTIEIRESWIV